MAAVQMSTSQCAFEKPSQGEMNAFDKLVQDMSDALGPSSGLDSDDVDPMDIQRLMEGYVSNSDDWHQFALSDSSRGYTRNLVDEGNGKSNLLLLVWTPGKGSLIHDHANAHCVMKIMQGNLTETLYAWPEQTFDVADAQKTPLKATRVTTYGVNEVTYMSDKLGLHRISNPDPEKFAVSLHLYTPPNAVTFGCRIFDEKTGKANHIRGDNFFSRHGQKL